MLLLAFIPRAPETAELLNVLNANTGVAGLALLVTAIQQTFSHELSLFHAIFTQHILFFLGIGIAPMGECALVSRPFVSRLPTNTGKYKWSRSRLAIGVVVQFLLIVAFTTWAIYLWARVEHFGSQNYLNYEVKYVIMFVNIRATAPWLRGIWITALVVSALVLSVVFGYNALRLFSMSEEEGTEDPDKVWTFSISYIQIMCVIRLFPTTCSRITA